MDEIHDCIYRANAAKVKAAFDHFNNRLKTQNPEASALLATSQDDWQAFASSSCKVFVKIHTEQIASDSLSNCWSSFSSARVKVLQSWEHEYGSK